MEVREVNAQMQTTPPPKTHCYKTIS